MSLHITFPTEYVKTQLQLDERAHPPRYRGIGEQGAVARGSEGRALGLRGSLTSSSPRGLRAADGPQPWRPGPVSRPQLPALRFHPQGGSQVRRAWGRGSHRRGHGQRQPPSHHCLPPQGSGCSSSSATTCGTPRDGWTARGGCFAAWVRAWPKPWWSCAPWRPLRWRGFLQLPPIPSWDLCARINPPHTLPPPPNTHTRLPPGLKGTSRALQPP